MPKSTPDSKLQLVAQQAIRKYGSVESAAEAVGLSPATLWRVSQSGRAIPRTKAVLGVWGAKSAENEINEMAPESISVMTREDLQHTRNVLLALVQFLDHYIGALAVNPRVNSGGLE
ncbi:hypothetical protein [Hylemonella gracilis]|uniref:hypothetical protein n=1 Tax=Hylemonella gracilis TaxID=80880 RepID=UPI00103B77DF|nr:hypothetical protein [Hylemonella gracilis]